MATQVWQLHQAKNKLSEVVENALSSGPQIITRHGVEAVVILSASEYRQMTVSQSSLSEFFRNSPLADAELDLSRDASMSRETLVL